jgi:lipoyl(octanoyl) transferase
MRAELPNRDVPPPSSSCEWSWLGRVDYQVALALQERVRNAILESRNRETLLLLEHDSVITIGRHAGSANVLATPEELQRLGVSLARASRGGDVTFHGPGQLVGYPIFRVRGGVRAHMMRMAEGVRLVLAELGIEAAWRDSHPGLWVGQEKICAVGIHVRRRVAIHGFALNVDVDLDGFRNIVPCGIVGAGVTSIARLGLLPPSLETLAERVASAFERSFDMRMQRVRANASRLQCAHADL